MPDTILSSVALAEINRDPGPHRAYMPVGTGWQWTNKRTTYVLVCVCMCVYMHVHRHIYTHQALVMSNGGTFHEDKWSKDWREESRVGVGWLYEIGSCEDLTERMTFERWELKAVRGQPRDRLRKSRQVDREEAVEREWTCLCREQLASPWGGSEVSRGRKKGRARRQGGLGNVRSSPALSDRCKGFALNSEWMERHWRTLHRTVTGNVLVFKSVLLTYGLQ